MPELSWITAAVFGNQYVDSIFVLASWKLFLKAESSDLSRAGDAVMLGLKYSVSQAASFFGSTGTPLRTRMFVSTRGQFEYRKQAEVLPTPGLPKLIPIFCWLRHASQSSLKLR